MNRLESLATESVATPAKLRQRLNAARGVLTDAFRRIFKDARFDFPNRRLLNLDGEYVLEWRVRMRPNEPEAYNNQQTSTGTVVLTNAKPEGSE